jgi:hypothetical protein
MGGADTLMGGGGDTLTGRRDTLAKVPALRWGIFGEGDTVWFTVDSTVTAEEFGLVWEAQRSEADTTAYPKVAGLLRLPLHSGGFSDFQDQGSDEAGDSYEHHTYQGFLPRINCYLVQTVAYESGGYTLVDRTDGTQHAFSEVPSLSPGPRWLACPYADPEASGPPYTLYLDLRRVVAGLLSGESLRQLLFDNGEVAQYGPVELLLPYYCQQLRYGWAGPNRLLIEASLANGQVVYWAWQAKE